MSHLQKKKKKLIKGGPSSSWAESGPFTWENASGWQKDHSRLCAAFPCPTANRGCHRVTALPKLLTGLLPLSSTQWIMESFEELGLDLMGLRKVLSYSRFNPPWTLRHQGPAGAQFSKVSKPQWGSEDTVQHYAFLLRVCVTSVAGDWPYFRSPCFHIPLYRTTICFSACLRRLAHWVSKPLGLRDLFNQGGK